MKKNRVMGSIPDIPTKYDLFPRDYVNDVRGWAVDRETIAANAGSLLTLDIDFGSRCSLNCPFCFRRNNSVDIRRHELQYNDLVEVINQAKRLGLRAVKFLGAGEPLENPGIIQFLQLLRDSEIVPVLFTKTGILGDDAAVARLFSDSGLHTGSDLAQFLYDCGASVVQGLNSFDDRRQCEMSGGDTDFIVRRNRTLELLVNTGFTSSVPTRLAIGINPVTKANVGEALDIYTWARVRNIYAIVTPTMISGRERGDAWRSITPDAETLIKLYTDIYRFNLDTHLTALKRLQEDGISAYAGGHPCNQVAAGLYVTLNGVVLSCPGSEENVEGNIWEESLENIWLGSRNHQRAGTFNCKCVAKDGKSIPKQLYESVMGRLT